jgi:hypothetical protein
VDRMGGSVFSWYQVESVDIMGESVFWWYQVGSVDRMGQSVFCWYQAGSVDKMGESVFSWYQVRKASQPYAVGVLCILYQERTVEEGCVPPFRAAELVPKGPLVFSI